MTALGCDWIRIWVILMGFASLTRADSSAIARIDYSRTAKNNVFGRNNGKGGIAPASTFLLDRNEIFPSFTRDELFRIQRHAYNIFSPIRNNDHSGTNLPYQVNQGSRFYTPFKPNLYYTSTSRTPLSFFESSTTESSKPIAEPNVEVQNWKNVETSKKFTKTPFRVHSDPLLDLSTTKSSKSISEPKAEKEKVEKSEKINKKSNISINTILKHQEKRRLQVVRNKTKKKPVYRRLKYPLAKKLTVSPLLPELLPSESISGSTVDAFTKIKSKKGSVNRGINNNLQQKFKVFKAIPEENF